jgi:hypothetical protein
VPQRCRARHHRHKRISVTFSLPPISWLLFLKQWQNIGQIYIKIYHGPHPGLLLEFACSSSKFSQLELLVWKYVAAVKIIRYGNFQVG